MTRALPWVLGLMLWLAWCAAAEAVVPVARSYKAHRDVNGKDVSYGVFGSKSAACSGAASAIAAEFASDYPNGLVGVPSNTDLFGSATCAVNTPSGSNVTTVIIDGPASSCPAHSTANGTDTCSCTPPYVENATQSACVLPPSEWDKKCNAVAGQGAGHLEWAGLGNNGCGNPGGLPSNQGCLVVAGEIVVRYQSTPGSWTSGSDTGSYTGATCVPNDTAPAATKDPCVNGQSSVVNGKQRCTPVDPSTPATQTDSTTTQNPDGSTTTTSSSTSCDSGKCTTTTTTTTSGAGGGSGGGGNGSSTTTTTESIGDYCKKSPETALCAKTNNGRGAETGDDKSDGPCDSKSTVIGCMKPGTPPADKEIPKATKSVGLGTVGVSGFSASCPAPTTFAVAGRSFTISYAPLCDSAGWIKPLILLMCAFISLSIVYSALKGA